MHTKRTLRWSAVGFIVVAALVAACGTVDRSQPTPSQGPTATPHASAGVTTAPAPSPSPSASVAAIVGEWVGSHDCERIRAMLHEVGLDEFIAEAIYGNGLIPGVTSEAGIADPANPCAGAVRRAHSHVFTADGRFASRDFNGQNVDGGTWAIVDDHTVVINGLPFGFRIAGDELTLDPRPIDISKCTTRDCRFPADWVLMVAMPGTSWTRGTIPG